MKIWSYRHGFLENDIAFWIEYREWNEFIRYIIHLNNRLLNGKFSFYWDQSFMCLDFLVQNILQKQYKVMWHNMIEKKMNSNLWEIQLWYATSKDRARAWDG